MKRSVLRIVLILLPITITALILGLAVGSTNLFELPLETAKIILLNLRLPRVLAALLAGVGLSVSGVLLQSVTGNALAAPNIIGVNSGAGFCCIVMLSFFPNALTLLPLGAFAGAFLTTLLIVYMSSRINAFRGTVILAGIAITALLNAGISLLSLLDSDVLSAYNAFSVGGLASVELNELSVPAIIIIVSLSVSLILSRRIHTLCLGDSLAASLGVRVRALRTVCLICASAAASAVVSFAGLLGFVGLVVPHISRKIAGEHPMPLLITSSLTGAVLVILADFLGRVILAPTEIPVGVIMALIGAPFFFVLLLQRRNGDA